MDTSPPRGNPLEPDSGELRRWIAIATDRIVAHLKGLETAPAVALEPDGGAARARALAAPLPRDGAPLEELLDELFDLRIPSGFGTAGPGYLAYVPGGGLPHAAIADLVASCVNRYVGVFAAAPLLAALELDVLRWFRDLAGFPSTGGGILTTGGSLANLSAVVAAREKHLPEDFLRGTIYTSDQTHHSVIKAARLAGFPARQVRVIESDVDFRVRLDALERAIRDDRAAGDHPFLVAAHGGTTNTGAVDDLAAIAALTRRESMWLHVDAAYGGPFLLTARGRTALAGIADADSITLDPHKGLFLPYGTGCLLVRDVRDLQRAHAATGDYMPSMQEAPDLLDFCALSPELSRGFRGLRVWLPLKMCGAAAFERALDEKLDLAREAEARLRALPRLEVLSPATLSTVSFRVRTVAGADPDGPTRRLLEAVNARRNVYLTPTLLHGRFAIRICVLSFRTHHRHVATALRDLEEELARL